MKSLLSSAPFLGRALLATAALTALPTLPADTAERRVVTVVKVPRPWYAPRFVLVRKFRQTIPEYQAAPGLLSKAYTLSTDGHFGGVYVWRDRAAAQAWFNGEWFARVRRLRGTDAEVRFFDAVRGFEAAGEIGTDGRAVVTLAPSGPGAEPADPARIFGLRRCFEVTGADGRAITVALWADAASARRFHGKAPGVEWFDAPVVIRTKAGR